MNEGFISNGGATVRRLRLGVIAAAAALVCAAPVHAEKVETKGGLRVSSDDGSFSIQLGGRIHFDTYVFDEDLVSTTGGTEFRRSRITLSGKAYGWDYKLEQDFSAGNTTAGYRDVFIGTKLLGGQIMLGQFKPFRSMEELTSSNEITMMERPFASATGIYSGRQFQQGVGYKTSGDMYTLGVSAFNLRDAAAARNEGVGAAVRATYTPIRSDSSTLHLGASYSMENANRATPVATATANYAGRRGPSQNIASSVLPGSNPAVTNRDSIDTIGLELAGTMGPFFAQAEYATASFGGGDTAPDQDVTTYYVMASWMLTGETKPYHGSNGVFRSVKPNSPSGAWELAARYDYIENDDVANLEVSTITVGLNYYLNQAVRFMLNYTMGDNELTGDETKQIALRGQMAF